MSNIELLHDERFYSLVCISKAGERMQSHEDLCVNSHSSTVQQSKVEAVQMFITGWKLNKMWCLLHLALVRTWWTLETCLAEKSRHKRPCVVWLHWYEIPGLDPCVEKKQTRVVWSWRGWGGDEELVQWVSLLRWWRCSKTDYVEGIQLSEHTQNHLSLCG